MYDEDDDNVIEEEEFRRMYIGGLGVSDDAYIEEVSSYFVSRLYSEIEGEGATKLTLPALLRYLAKNPQVCTLRLCLPTRQPVYLPTLTCLFMCTCLPVCTLRAWLCHVCQITDIYGMFGRTLPDGHTSAAAAAASATAGGRLGTADSRSSLGSRSGLRSSGGGRDSRPPPSQMAKEMWARIEGRAATNRRGYDVDGDGVDDYSPHKVQEMLAGLGVDISVAALAGAADNIWGPSGVSFDSED